MSKVKTNILNSLLIVFTFIFFISLFVINNVKAVDVVFKIESASIKEKSSTVVGSINSSDSIINSDVTFNKVGDYALYELEFKNTTDNEIIIDSITDNNSNEYIEYEYDNHQNYKVKANDKFTLSIKVTYKNAVNNIDNRIQDNNVSFTINYNENKKESFDIVNPNTYDSLSIDIVLAIISLLGIIICLVLKNKKAHTLLLMLLILPIIVKADTSKLNFTFKTNINFNDKLKVSYSLNNKDYEAIVNYGDKLTIDVDGILLLEDGTNFDINTPITSDLKLKVIKEYDISFNLNGGTLPDNYPTKYTIEDEITLPSPSKDGYTFTGWTGSNGGTPQITVKILKGSSENKNYVAHWNPINYDITYDLAGGTLPDNYSTGYTIESDTFTLKNPSKEGYEFTGWTGTNLTNKTKTVTILKGSMGDRNYTAHWSEEVYEITYNNIDGATINPANPEEYDTEDEITLINPSKEGYTFTGWTGSNGTIPQTTVKILQGSTGSKSYTANWDLVTYNINYILDGGTLPDVHPTSYTIESNSITLVNPTKEGFIFAGWTGPNGETPQTTVIIPQGSTGSKSYTANWTDEYTIVFHSNNGQDQTYRQVVKFDQEFVLDENTFTNEDKEFKEWTTKLDGTGVKYINKRVKYANSARTEMTSTYYKVVNLPIDENLEIHLYAQWQESNLTKTTFDKGQNVNKIMKQLAGNSESTYTSTDTNIRYIKRATDEEYHLTTADKVNVTTSYFEYYYDKPIYMWFDNGTIYYYSEADIIYLNETSSYLFNNLTELISVDLSGIDTSIVQNMESMFNNCGKIKTLNLRNFNTSNVKTMQYMFNGCENLTSLDVSSFNTSNVTTMKNMFSSCKELETLDIINFNTFNVKNMQKMFEDMYKLKALDLSNFNTSKVTLMNEMFENMIAITSLDLSSFNTSSVTTINRMFYGMTNLRTLDLSSFDTAGVTNMSLLFSNCESLSVLDLSSFDTSNVTNMSSMFASCSSLESLNISSFNTSKVTDMNRMFADVSSIKSLDVSSFNTESVTNMEKMFSNMKNIETIYVSEDFVTNSVTNGNQMFVYDTTNPSIDQPDAKLTGGDGTKYNKNHLGKDYARIDDPDNGNPGYFTRK